jgi:hypothetical protein
VSVIGSIRIWVTAGTRPPVDVAARAQVERDLATTPATTTVPAGRCLICRTGLALVKVLDSGGTPGRVCRACAGDMPLTMLPADYTHREVPSNA